MKAKSSKVPFHQREISWLSFNERVLQEAEDDSVPLIERLRFLGIFSSNLDEFFRVRVPTVQKMIRYGGTKAVQVIGYDPEDTLQHINDINLRLIEKFERIYADITKQLEKERVFFLNEQQLNEQQLQSVSSYFEEKVWPALVPIMLDRKRDLPELNGKSIYLAIKLYNDSAEGTQENIRFAILEVPSLVIPRFYVIPSEGEETNIILLDDIIRVALHRIFAIFNYDHIEAYTVKLTRDAELDMEDNITTSLLEKLTTSLKNRKTGEPVRFVHDAKMPEDLLNFLLRKIDLEPDDYIVPGGRYHNFKDFIGFPKIGAEHLRYEKLPPLHHPDLEDAVSVLNVIRKKDVMLSYPYQSYKYIITLLREAAIDPKVNSIKITIYRLESKNSKIVHTLINAAKNGKSVTVVVELKARFDEESNMQYAYKLEDAGVKVIFGAPGLKVHTKLLIIRRKEGEKSVRYAHIGTGNFHEGTANLYCDHSLLTANQKITNEVNKVFQFFNNNYKRNRFRHLIVAPFNARRQFYKLIDTEIKNAKAGLPAYMIIKVNNLNDKGITTRLYEASRAGVKVQLIARSVSNLVNGLEGLSENVEAISIIDRFLEHARVLIFANGGEEKMYLGSADWMSRNLDRRVEVMTPIYDKEIQQELRHIIQLQLDDNQKSRLLDKALSNHYKTSDLPPLRAQYATYAYYKQKWEAKQEQRAIAFAVENEGKGN